MSLGLPGAKGDRLQSYFFQDCLDTHTKDFEAWNFPVCRTINLWHEVGLLLSHKSPYFLFSLLFEIALFCPHWPGFELGPFRLFKT